MCGIVGIVSPAATGSVALSDLRRMCDAIVHRGPDDEGVCVRGGAGLGMRRLSIIDVAGGQQPIHNEDRTVWVVFNGEIYNFPLLRQSLEARGHHFYTQSDTEVIVHLYEEMGSDCVRELRGMFAVALYDERQQKLLLARDRLGKKPLHYALRGGRLLFGSEIKALLAVAPDLAEVNRSALLQYFYFGYILDPQTAFTPISKLPPGHLLEFTGGKITVRSYWDVPPFATYDPASEEECLAELESRVAEAVKIRLISEVPLGALLSGGVDSSLVVALMARANARPVKTFTIGFQKADFDEAPFARRVAERFGTEHQELVVEPNFAEAVQRLTAHLEEPFADSSMIPTWYISRLARQHVTVALAGDGGDELFAGYTRYQIQLGRDGYPLLPGGAGRWFRAHIYPWLPSGFPGRQLLYHLSLPASDRYLDNLTSLSCTRDRSLFTSDFLAWADQVESPWQQMLQAIEARKAPDALSRMQYLDTKAYLPGDILTKVDRMSMAVSLEMRAPLLDHEVVEWVTRLHPRWKMRDGAGKYILKKLADRVGVPREVLYRRKQGFAMPLVHWFREAFREDLVRILLEPRTLQRGYFREPGVRQLLNEHFRKRRDWSGQIWLLLMFELWHRNFLEDRRPAPAASLSPVLSEPWHATPASSQEAAATSPLPARDLAK